jgi:hypothetical protein
MKKLSNAVLAFVAASFMVLTVMCFSSYAGDTSFTSPQLSYAFSNPGFYSVVTSPSFTGHRVMSWSTTSNKAATGYIQSSGSKASYSASFSGKSGYAIGSSTIIKTANGTISRSSASAYVTTK